MIDLKKFDSMEQLFIDEVMEELINHALKMEILSIQGMINKVDTFDMGKTNLSFKERLECLERLPLECAKEISCLPQYIEEETESYLKDFFEGIVKDILNEYIQDLKSYLEKRNLHLSDIEIVDDYHNLNSVYDNFDFCGIKMLFKTA